MYKHKVVMKSVTFRLESVLSKTLHREAIYK